MLFWKTQNLYYVKTDRLFRSMTVALDEQPDQKLLFDVSAISKQAFAFDATTLENKQNNEKRSLVFEYKGQSKADNTLQFIVLYSERGKKTDTKEILKAIKQDGVKVTEDQLTRAFRVFERQTEVDFFINKNAKAFLTEQFDLWMYQYIFKGSTDFTAKRVAELQSLKRIAVAIIDFISQFEDELVRIWNKPKFVREAGYVITFDKIRDRDTLLATELVKSASFKDQVAEWRDLKLIEDSFAPEQLFTETPLKYLPIDTKYFRYAESRIIALFENLDEELDGRLISGESYQALRTLAKKHVQNVECIYIDPPFNLGDNADFQYLTNYQDATWLGLLESRLNTAFELLNDDKGLVFVRCDYHGAHLVRQLITYFGMSFKAEILVDRSRNEAGSPNKLEATYEHVFLFSKTDSPLTKFTVKRSLANIKWTGFLMAGDRNPRERTFLGKTLSPPKGQHFSLKQEKVEKLLKESFLRLKCRSDECGTLYFYGESDQELTKRMKRKKERFKFYDIDVDTVFHGLKFIDTCLECGAERFAVEYLGSDEVFVNDNWLDIPSYARNWDFPTENSEDLLLRVESFVEGTVLDFFSGSATTAAVAQKIGRKWLSIDMAAHVFSTELPRMKCVLAGDASGISKQVGWKGGGFFKYFSFEQYEDALKRSVYLDEADSSLTMFENPYETPFSSYVFLRDPKMSDALDIDYKANKVRVDFSKLYDDIDWAETLSCVKGKFIKSQTPDSVTFTDDVTIHFDSIDYRDILPLIWWDK